MTTHLATALGIHESPELSERDRDAAQAIAARVRDAKATSTRLIYASVWKQFETWVQADRHQALPATPQTVTLNLWHLTYTGQPIASIEKARAVISHLHASAGMQKTDNPARHPVVAEAVKGWRNRAPAPRQADALTAQRRAALDLAIIAVLADGGLSRSEAAALTWKDVELWSDGTGRITVQKGKNQVEPQTAAVTAATPGRSGRSAPRTPTPQLRCSD